MGTGTGIGVRIRARDGDRDWDQGQDQGRDGGRDRVWNRDQDGIRTVPEPSLPFPRRNLLVNLGLFAAGVWVARNLTDIDLMAPQPVP
ncbi:PREDICTED: mitochondrial import receptor subunit TOM6 homolog [Acanthisitta chloris]|uniref:mitochondrial import receptor subunit TOM6 homolog n=1 Tax=Acanthisitta chloris TaxID=57068 RepID=UPI0004F0F03C|nr:PREDICTED: mitochondrial import receptor subunit TOM6 homolog [Acanthisitta chloris]